MKNTRLPQAVLPLALCLFAISCAGENSRFTELGMDGGRANAPIVNGSRDPTNVILSQSQMRAIGYLAYASGENFCTGTLISARIVITARHCIDGVSASRTYFGIGVDPENPDALLPVQEIHAHPSVDFAVLFLGADALDQGISVTPLDMNRETLSSDWIGRWVDASGYGQTYSDATGRFFASVELIAYDNAPDWDISVDGHGIQGICYGDSGGPILWQADVDSPVLVLGTEQYGDSSCVDRDYLTRVDYVADWVDEITANGLPAPLQTCGDITFEGECSDSATVSWCGGGYLRQQDCSEASQACGYMGPDYGYACIPDDCGNVDYLGACDDNTLSYCTTRGFRQENCTSSGELCVWENDESGFNCVSNQCNGVEIDLRISEEHCGSCDNLCDPVNAEGHCQMGRCVIDSCDSGFVDTDEDADNGCEADYVAPEPAPAAVEKGCGGCQGASGGMFAFLLVVPMILRRRGFLRGEFLARS